MAKTGPKSDTQPRRRLLDRAILTVVSTLTHIVWQIPWPIWSALTSIAGFLAMFTSRRHVVLANVRHVRVDAPPHPIVAWYIGAQQIATHLQAVIGTLRGEYRLPDTDQLMLEGIEAVRPHLGKHGVIIVAPHAGPYTMLGLMGRRWLAEQDFSGELAIVARMFRPFRSGALMEWFMDYFHRAGINVISVHEQPQTMAKRLRNVLENNGIVVLLVDEPTPTPSAVVPFFDSAIKMPLGPVRLARATGSVIVPAIASYERRGKLKITLGDPQLPASTVTEGMHRMARGLEPLISRYLKQWGMLTLIWIDEQPHPPAAPDGHSFADLHLHTQGSDGLLRAEEWIDAARDGGVSVIAITDHDHIATVRDWKRRDPEGTCHVIPGVELTARGRIVHLGVLFPADVPDELPRPGTPLLDLVRWARGIEGSIVVLVHPLPLLWRGQLRRMARAGLLPDAIESRFPLVGKRSAAIERAALRYGLAVLGGSDAHLAPGEIGGHATLFPGETVEDLLAALRMGRTRAVTLSPARRVPRGVYVMQTAYSWLLPFRLLPGVDPARAALLRRARLVAQRDGRRAHARSSLPSQAREAVRVSS